MVPSRRCANPHPRKLPLCRYTHFKSRIQGVIFDSAPCYMHANTGATALGEGQPAVVRVLAAALFYLILLVMMLAQPKAPTKFW